MLNFLSSFNIVIKYVIRCALTCWTYFCLMLVVLFLRYLYSVKSYWPKTALSAYPARGIFGPPTPPPKKKQQLNNDLWAWNLHKTENSGGPTYPPNLVFLGGPGANRQWRVVPTPPPGRPRYGKGPGRARVKWRRGIFGILGNIARSKR